MLSLLVFGGIALEGDQGPLSGPATQRHRLALVALLASAHPRGLLREKLIAYLWPERGPGRARNLLNQAVHAVRSGVGEGALVTTGDELRLDPGVLACDLIAFERAMHENDFARAVACYRGPFLDGFFLPDAGEFERWLDTERRRLAESYRRALDGLARAAATAGDGRAAVEWWRRLAADDPYNADVTLHLMRALEAVGDRAAAIEAGRVYSVLVSGDLGAEPDPAVRALADHMRTEPTRRPRRVRRPSATRGLSGARAAAPPSVTNPAPSRPTGRFGTRSILTFAAGTIMVAATVVALQGGLVQPAAIAGRDTGPVVDTALRSQRILGVVTSDTSAGAVVRGDLTSDQYLRQADEAKELSAAGNREVVRLLRLALRADSNNAEAWARLATLYGWQAPYFGVPTSVWDSALVFAHHALRLDPSSAEAYTALAVAYGHQGLLAREERMALEALRRDPRHSLAIRRLAESYHERGQFLEALRYHRETVRLEPTDRAYRSWVGNLLADLHAYGAAEKWYRGVLALEPDHLPALEGMATLYLRWRAVDSARHYAAEMARLHPHETVAWVGAAAVSHYLRDAADARRFAGRAVEIAAGAPVRTPNTVLATTLLGFAERVDGDTAGSEAHFDQSARFLRARLASGADSPRWPYELALIDAVRGDTAAALEELDQAYALGFRWVWMLEAEPMLDGVRHAPRFEELVARTRADVASMRQRL